MSRRSDGQRYGLPASPAGATEDQPDAPSRGGRRRPERVHLWAGTGYRHATGELAATVLTRLAASA